MQNNRYNQVVDPHWSKPGDGTESDQLDNQLFETNTVIQLYCTSSRLLDAVK